MKFIPIPFSTLMVQAILDGNKTQTRRVIKTQPPTEDFLNAGNAIAFNTEKCLNHTVYCPFGKAGNVLWVREEHLITMTEDRKWITVQFKDLEVVRYYYKDLSLNLLKKLYKRKTIGEWQRARFLPREFARIFLEVTKIRAERLHDISEEDAISEGIDMHENEGEDLFYIYPPKDKRRCISFGGLIRVDGTYVSKSSGFFNEAPAKNSFLSLFQSINGGDAWKENPWLWVIEFKRIVKPRSF